MQISKYVCEQVQDIAVQIKQNSSYKMCVYVWLCVCECVCLVCW